MAGGNGKVQNRKQLMDAPQFSFSTLRLPLILMGSQNSPEVGILGLVTFNFYVHSYYLRSGSHRRHYQSAN